MVYMKNLSFQSYEFYREKLNPESENSLISGVFHSDGTNAWNFR